MKHRMSRTPIHNIWWAMMCRCTNKSDKLYKYYGGRGIKVCEKWREFLGFFEDMGHRPDKLSLERVDNDADYCLENCKWATKKEQARNKRSNVIIEINGISRHLIDWFDVLSFSKGTYYNRIKNGMSPKEALTKPVRKKKVIKTSKKMTDVRKLKDFDPKLYGDVLDLESYMYRLMDEMTSEITKVRDLTLAGKHKKARELFEKIKKKVQAKDLN